MKSLHLFGWWDRFLLPERRATTPQQVEQAHKALYISRLLLGCLLLDLFHLVERLDQPMIVLALCAGTLIVLAGSLNRCGWITPAAVVCVLCLLLTELLSLQTSGGVIDASHAGYFSLAIVTGAMLGPRTAFLLATVNALIIIGSLLAQSPPPAVAMVLHGYLFPALFQLVIGLAISWVLKMRSQYVAETARLQQRMKRAEQEKGVLDQDMQLIHQVAQQHLLKTDTTARLSPGSLRILWPLQDALNALFEQSSALPKKRLFGGKRSARR